MCQLCVIAESDPFIAQLLRRFAEQCNFSVISECTGSKVISVIHELKPTLLVLDVDLPGELSGWQILQILQDQLIIEKMAIITTSWDNKKENTHDVFPKSSRLTKPAINYNDFLDALRAANLSMDFKSIEGEGGDLLNNLNN